MSTSQLMSIGMRAMSAAYAQLTTSSNNVANANTPGYSRQQVQQAAIPGQYSGSGYIGRGVTVETVKRASDMFLTQRAAATGANAASDAARRDMLQQLEKLFGTGAAGLGASATDIFNAFADLAAAPADLSARVAVLGKLQNFASMAQSNSDSVAALQSNVVADVRNSVGDVNQMLVSVAALNRSIAETQGSGQTPNDLLDQRDTLIARISQEIEVHGVAAPDGTMSVFTASGQTLVLGTEANQLVAQPDAYDPRRVALALKAGGGLTPLDAGALGGGSISGKLAFQDNDLAVASGRLGLLVSGLVGMLNRQQSLGIDLSGRPGTAMFQLAAPAALPAATNATAGGQFISRVSVAVTDSSALQASEYVLANDSANPGRYTVTRLSDGQVTSNLASGAAVDGFSINVGVPLAAGDRFLLQPVGGAAGSVQVALADPRALAAASPLSASADSANTGSGGIASLAITAAPGSPYQSLSLHFTSAGGDWELLDAANNVQATGTLVPGQPLAYNGFALSFTGAPALNDRFTIAPTTFPASSNGNALAMNDLASAAVVAGSTITNAYAQFLSDLGSRTSSASAVAETSTNVAAASTAALTAETGVNIDEEAARLIQYQQSYQAAAKILQTAQTILDTLIQMRSA